MTGVLLVVALIACSDESDPDCVQTDHGNYGCAEVVGRLVDRNDQPLGGPAYSVVNRDLPPGSRFGTNVMPTIPDTSGRFQLRITRTLLLGPTTVPDTGSVWIIGTQRPPVTSSEPGPRDSMLVTLQFFPPGAPPVPTEVLIRLPLP